MFLEKDDAVYSGKKHFIVFPKNVRVFSLFILYICNCLNERPMEFSTRITIPKATFTFSYDDPVVLIGSCFAENIGHRMKEARFPVDMNPFGILYNPASVSRAVRRLLDPEPYAAKDLFFRDGLYHSFDHHSRFSSASEADCLQRINDRLERSALSFQKARRLVITFGTAFVYRLSADRRIVSNCHKLPEKQFVRSRLSPEEITADWRALLRSVWQRNPDLNVLFTVSPIRHWKDGAHANQLSKAALLLAIEALQTEFPDRTDYFPSYELLMDELRDYRFYADDMLHPSPVAVEYIWRRFVDSRLSPDALRLLNEWEEIQKALNHKPFQPDSEAYKRFLLQTLLKMERIREKIPSFDLAKEIDTVKSKLM